MRRPELGNKIGALVALGSRAKRSEEIDTRVRDATRDTRR